MPTYNEAGNIAELIARIERALAGSDFEIVIVDDNSPDGTAEVAERVGAIYGNVKVLRRPSKMGLASAILDGMSIAEGDVIAVMDADLQHPPEVLPRMLKRIREGYDLVIASRYIEGGGVEGWSLTRLLMSKVASIIAHIVLPETRGVRDPMSGYFMFRREVLNGVKLSPVGFKILLEVLVKGRYSRVTEVPYIFQRRTRGESKLGLKVIFNYVEHVLRLSQYRVLKFAIVGASGILVNEGVLFLLVEAGVPIPLSGVAAIMSSVLNNFVLNDRWTFNERREGNVLVRFVKYCASVALGMTINLATLILLTALGVNYLIANLVGIFLGFLANYIAAEMAVWRGTRGE